MKNNLFKSVLALSLLFNVTFLGAAVYTQYQQTNQRGVPSDSGVQNGIATCPSNQQHLFEALSLKPDQRKVFEQKASLFHEDLDRKKAEMNRLRKSLFELMRGEHPDAGAIEATRAALNRKQQEIQKMVVAHMLEFKSLLDKDQQKQFFDLIQEAMASRRETHCP